MGRIKAYFRLDLYFFENPKTVDLSHAATVLYIAAIAHANRRETDGFVHRKVLRRLVDLDPTLEYEPTHAELAEELVKAGLWEPAEEGWQIHDFLEHNDSSQEREDRREAERDRKRRERERVKGSRPDGPKPPSGGPSGSVRADNSGRPQGSDQTKTPGGHLDVDVALPSLPSSPDVSSFLTVVGVDPDQPKRTEGQGKGRPPRTPRHRADPFVVARAREIQATDGTDAARAYLRKVDATYGQASQRDQLRRLEEIIAQDQAAETGQP